MMKKRSKNFKNLVSVGWAGFQCRNNETTSLHSTLKAVNVNFTDVAGKLKEN
jgi:hypothetical protein